MTTWTPAAVDELEVRLRNGTLDRLELDPGDHEANQADYHRAAEFFAHYRELRDALSFYANYETWHVEGWDQDCAATDDGGKRARAVLGDAGVDA